jgi:probable F420-dependent oxidoreductase
VTPFRFSVSLPAARTAGEVRDFARKAEDLGFDVLTTADHLGDLLAPFPPLVVAAEATTRLKVGTLVINNDLRHPVLLAREAAAIQALSDGRFELGIGAGHAFLEYESIGLAFEEGPTRVARLAESAAIIRGLFAGQSFSFDGDHYRLARHTVYPASGAAPPLLIGGNARSLLRLAARTADIVGFTGLGRTQADGLTHDPSGFWPGAVDERVSLVRQAAGDRFDSLELNALVQAVVPGDPRKAAAGLTERLPGLLENDLLASPFVLLGTPQDMAEALLARRERWGLSYFSIFAPSMDRLAPVIPLVK